MSLSTFSKFYYGFTITELNNSIDFSEGGPELQAVLNSGDYTLEEFLVEIKRAMDVVGALTYSVSVNRSTRIITISSSSSFELLGASGTRIGTGAWSLMGFSATDLTGASTYDGQSGAGYEYLPQALLKDHVPSENWAEQQDASVNSTASGEVQVVTFGIVRYLQANIWLANNKMQSACQPEIETNASGVSDLITFMDYAITKAKMEFMPNRSVSSSFYSCLLESTPESRQGIAYKLKEIKDAGGGYFETGPLVFRIVEV